MTIAKVDSTTFQATPASSRRSLLRLMWVTLRDSFLAYRRYDYLMSKGTPHRTAITKAFGTSPPQQ